MVERRLEEQRQSESKIFWSYFGLYSKQYLFLCPGSHGGRKPTAKGCQVRPSLPQKTATVAAGMLLISLEYGQTNFAWFSQLLKSLDLSSGYSKCRFLKEFFNIYQQVVTKYIPCSVFEHYERISGCVFEVQMYFNGNECFICALVSSGPVLFRDFRCIL